MDYRTIESMEVENKGILIIDPYYLFNEPYYTGYFDATNINCIVSKEFYPDSIHMIELDDIDLCKIDIHTALGCFDIASFDRPIKLDNLNSRGVILPNFTGELSFIETYEIFTYGTYTVPRLKGEGNYNFITKQIGFK